MSDASCTSHIEEEVITSQGSGTAATFTDLGLAPDDGIPKIPRQAHLVAGIDVSVTENSGGWIEQITVERQRDASSVSHDVDDIARRRCDVLGIVILHGLFQQCEGGGDVPLSSEVRQ